MPASAVAKILIMDDEIPIREMVGDYFRDLNYDVEAVNNGDEAITAYKRALNSSLPVDVAILDIAIPGGMGGMETVHNLWEINPDVKTIVITGYTDHPVMKDYRNFGFSKALAKPFRMEELRQLVEEILHNR